MHRLNELAEKLTPAQLKQVEDYAESLVASKTVAAPEPKFLDVDTVAGMFAGLAPDKSDVELAHEASDVIFEKYKDR
jgi:hypothetical protein